ncbi:MAG: Asp-tRNA(Asn)/Glu-tRNA(Gln) amidotransferase subunit GatA [Halobacteriaceae archaeon]
MTINAYITEESISGSDSGQLSDATIAIKDNISTKGVRTTCGSEMLADYVPPYDATVISRLKQAGATISGKTNMDEFGMGTTTETSAFGPTKNPHDHSRVPGGSSGGSAAAVANGDVEYALGSDTGGSVRCPAAFCGVVGLKPTYGLVSRYGLIAYANSLEQIGPITATVEKAAKLLEAIAGKDEHDATTRSLPIPAYTDAIGQDISDLTIGVVTELIEGVDEDVKDVFEAKCNELAARGATVTDISIPALEYAVPAYYVIAMSEASSNLARFDGVRYGISGGYDGDWNDAFAKSRDAGFGDEVKRRILLGTYALSAGYHEKYYEQAQSARSHIRNSFDNAFDDVDILASPTMPTTPFKLGESLSDPLKMYLADVNTVGANLANIPAISVPAGTANDLPVGIQFMGPAFEEKTLFKVASATA